MLWLAIFTGTLTAGAVTAPPTAQAADDDASRAAVGLLTRSMSVQPDGSHNQLLRALRHLRDPALRPMFEALSQAEHPSLRVHGLLGLAEISDPPRLGLNQVAQIESTGVQAELIGAALDEGLIPEQDARALLGWADLDMGVKLLIATRLIEEKKFDQIEVLQAAAQSNTLARRSLASLLLLEMDDSSGLEGLRTLNDSQDQTRDATQAMLLDTAMRHGLRSIGPWAYSLATDPEAEPGMQLFGLRTAMRFGDRRAVELWRQKFLEQQELAEQIRFALIALHLSPWLDAKAFEPLLKSNEPFLQRIGQAGAAIARDDGDSEVRMILLLETCHNPTARWALNYASEVASPEDAHQILLGLILVYEQGPARGREVRLANAIEASRTLANLDAAQAHNLLRPIVASSKTDEQLRQAILLGLIQSRPVDVGKVITGLPDFTDPTTNQLALLLRQRAGEPLSLRQLKDVAVLVRGGGEVQDPLRIQAGWHYLKQTGQAKAAISEALSAARQ